MTDTPTIAVRGEATLDVDAEVAEFTASVEVHEAERVTTLERVAERVAAVRGVLDRFRDAIERHATSHLSASAEKHHHTGEVSYHGNATTTVVMSDPDAVGDVMRAVASLAEVSVWGPSWSVRPASPMPASAAGSPRLDPQRLQLRASIEARFTISEPTILAAPID